MIATAISSAVPSRPIGWRATRPARAALGSRRRRQEPPDPRRVDGAGADAVHADALARVVGRHREGERVAPRPCSRRSTRAWGGPSTTRSRRRSRSPGLRDLRRCGRHARASRTMPKHVHVEDALPLVERVLLDACPARRSRRCSRGRRSRRSASRPRPPLRRPTPDRSRRTTSGSTPSRAGGGRRSSAATRAPSARIALERGQADPGAGAGDQRHQAFHREQTHRVASSTCSAALCTSRSAAPASSSPRSAPVQRAPARVLDLREARQRRVRDHAIGDGAAGDREPARVDLVPAALAPRTRRRARTPPRSRPRGGAPPPSTGARRARARRRDRRRSSGSPTRGSPRTSAGRAGRSR